MIMAQNFFIYNFIRATSYYGGGTLFFSDG